MVYRKPNIRVGQVADLEDKSASRKSTIRDDLRSMQQQLTAALIRETEYLALLRECKDINATALEDSPEGSMHWLMFLGLAKKLEHI